MAQLSIASAMPGLQRGMLGMRRDKCHIVTRFNARAETRTATITFAAAQTHTINIAGYDIDGTFQSVPPIVVNSTTSDAVTAGLISAAIAASALANSIVSVSVATNVVTLVGRRAGGLVITGSATGAAATVVATSVSEEQLEAGIMVALDVAGDKRIRLPATGIIIPEGITLFPHVEDSTQSLTALNLWPARFDVEILRRGLIGMYTEQAVTPATTPHFRHNPNGALTTRGALRTDVDGGNATSFAAFARVMSTTPAGGVALVDLNMP